MILKPDVGWAQNLKNCGYKFVFFLLGHDGYRIFESVECYDTQNGNYKYLVEIQKMAELLFSFFLKILGHLLHQ